MVSIQNGVRIILIFLHSRPAFCFGALISQRTTPYMYLLGGFKNTELYI